MPNDHLVPRDTPLRPGDPAPDFTLPTQDRAEWTLSEALRSGPVALCFYPLDFSPVCSTEMKCITDEFNAWRQKGAQVVGISCDSFFAHKAWAEQLGLKQTLLSDIHRRVCKAYGLYWPDMNVSTRATVAITAGPDAKPRVKALQAREIKTALTAQDLLAALS